MKKTQFTKEQIRQIKAVLSVVVDKWGKDYPGSSVGISAAIAKELLTLPIFNPEADI